MIISDINIFFSLFIILFFSITFNTNTSLHLLLTAELLWITLYIITLFLGLVYDNINLLSLTFFFLVFSAVEFGVGLVLLLLQNVVTRSLNLSNNDNNFTKFSSRLKGKLYLNKINWSL